MLLVLVPVLLVAVLDVPPPVVLLVVVPLKPPDVDDSGEFNLITLKHTHF